ncbi:MAG: hypothetical protein Q8L65_12305 [Burkholderiales bacterium]|nr:hypothetical protein [Burkholderiales bacterium]
MSEVQAALDQYATNQGLRQRRRRPVDQTNYERAVAAVVVDLMYWHLTTPGKWVAVSLSNRHVRKSRYRSPVLGNTFSALLDRMAHPDAGWIEVIKGGVRPFGPHNMATTIRAAPRLIKRAGELSVSMEDFGIDDTDET